MKITVTNNNQIGKVTFGKITRVGTISANDIVDIGPEVYDKVNAAYGQANAAYTSANAAANTVAVYANDTIVISKANINFNNSSSLNVSVAANNTTKRANVSFAVNTNPLVLRAGDTMTGNLNVAATIISQNIVPNLNVTYDLGTSTQRFKDLYLSGNSLYLGDTIISAADGELRSNVFNAAVAVLVQGESLLPKINAAYEQANTGRLDANSTFATINATFANVNTTFATLNTSAGLQNTAITNAHNQANTAYAQANAARLDANTTFATVNSTFANVNTTFDTLNTSAGLQNTAITNAHNQANAAYAEANIKLNLTGGVLSGDLTVAGNLIVSGNSTTLNTEILVVEDADIVLLSNVTSTPALNAGVIINRGTSTNTFLRWNESTDKWGWSDDGSAFYSFDTALNAYAQANTARSDANTTFATINTTFGTVNSTFGTVNTAITNAHNQANAARSQANTAYAQANAAYAEANVKVNIAGGSITGTLNVATLNVNANASIYETLFVNTSITTGGSNGTISGVNTIYASTFSSNGVNVTAQAASAYDQANAARAQANTARSDANTTFATINNTFSTINTTFGSVNTAITNAHNQANDAYTQANAARSDANTTFATINTTFGTINTTFGTVNTAITNAHNQANAAYNTANLVYLPSVTRLAVTSNSAVGYQFDQYGSGVNNPNVYVRAGETLAFSLDTPGHPFNIRVSSGGAAYNTGLYHVASNGAAVLGANAQGKTSGTLYWKVPFELAGNVYAYQCSVHSGMVGNVVIEYDSTVIHAQANAARDQANTARTTANDAYAQANTARDQANTARDQANTAYDQANTAYGQANNAYAQANLAYAQANTGYAQANDAYAQANAGYAQANTARATANDAYAQANAAYAQANTGRQDANTTFVNINLTFATINSTFGTVNTAVTNAHNQANAAYGQANDAYAQANTARDQANTARDTANAAYSQANTGYAQANAAYAQANAARDQANTGYAQANTARDTANAAYLQANTARDTANDAYGQANAARSQANTAYAQANAAYNDSNTRVLRAGDTMTGNLNVASTIITQNVIPNLNVTYNIGSTDNRYVAVHTSKIKLGDALLEANGTALSVDGVVIQGTNVIVNITDAYNQANAARAQANGAFDQANAAYAQANAARSDANTTFATINTTFGSVNTAITNAHNQANTARGQANDAYAQANAAYAEANLKLNLTGGTINGSLNISGNLVITGNTTFVNANSYVVNDPLIFLGANNIINDVLDIGFIGAKNTGSGVTHTGLARDAGDATWYLFDNLLDSGHENNVIDFANTTLATLRANISANSIVLLGNTVATQANLTIAHNQANAAYGQANLAYTQANAARSQANDAYAQANAAYAEANLKFNVVGGTISGNVTVTGDLFVEGNNAVLNVGSVKTENNIIMNSGYVGNNPELQADSGNAYIVVNRGGGVRPNSMIFYDENAVQWKYYDGQAGEGYIAFDTMQLAYQQANTAYAQANAAANQVHIRVTNQPNGVSTAEFSNHKMQLQNTSTVQIDVGTVSYVDGVYANVRFHVLGLNTAHDQANTAYDQANAAYAAANNRVLKAGDTMTGNLNVAATIISQNIIPNLNVTYNVGSTTNVFSAIHANTIKLGGATITSNGTALVIDGVEIQGSNVAFDVTASYNQANAARAQANSAYDQANAAYAQANTARSDANTTFATINTTFGTVNTAITNAHNQANAAYAQANAARSDANTTFATINTTFGTINSTFGTVNTAITNAHNQANNAYAQANLAYAQANTGYAQANSAYDQANAAYAQANAARSDANTTFATINTTFATINTTFGTVNTAITNAHNQANTARDTANAAYNQANSNYQPAVTRLDVTASGSSAYLFDQYSGNNPTLYVRAGESLAFSLNTAGHPFNIRVSSGGSSYSNGLTHVSNTGVITYTSSAQGKESGTLYWKVPYELQGNTYVYQCSVHAGMVGNIVIEPPMVVAYDQANNAYAQANLAYTQANAAYAQANAPLTVKEIYVSNSTVVNSYTNINTIQFDSDSGMAVVNAAANTVTIQLNSTFKNWNVDGNTGLVAVGLDTVNFIAGSGMTITANNSNTPKSIIFSSTGGGGGGSALTVQEEGTNLNTAVTSINFVGEGVTATANGSNITVTINNGGSGIASVESDVFSANGVQNTFTLTAATTTDRALVYISGVAQVPVVDYQVSGTTLSFNAAPLSGTTVEVRSLINDGSPANTVRVSQNSGSTLSAKQLNFVNTANVTITVTDSGDGNANVAIFSAAGGGGSALTIKDDGTSLNTSVSTIDFVGTGVTATANGNNVTVTIPAGLSNTIVKTTSYTATNADANLTYSLPVAPISPAYLFVIKNGVVLTPNTDYSVSNTTLTVIESGSANDVIEVRYFDQLNVYESANTLIEVTSNVVAAQTNTFTLANVTAINRIAITKNGLQLTPNLHYSINTSSNTVTLNTVAEIGDTLTFTNFRNVNDIAGGGGLVQYTYNTSTSSIETVDEWSKSTYRSAKYQMQVESGSGYQAVDIMVIHDGVDTNTIQYGSSTFGANVGVFTSDISGSNVRLRFTATDATSYLTYYKTILASRASESLPTDLMTGSDTYDLLVTLPFHPTDLN